MVEVDDGDQREGGMDVGPQARCFLVQRPPRSIGDALDKLGQPMGSTRDKAPQQTNRLCCGRAEACMVVVVAAVPGPGMSMDVVGGSARKLEGVFRGLAAVIHAVGRTHVWRE